MNGHAEAAWATVRDDDLTALANGDEETHHRLVRTSSHYRTAVAWGYAALARDYVSGVRLYPKRGDE